MTLRRMGSEPIASGVFLHLDRVWVGGQTGPAVARDVIRHPGGVGVLPVDGEEVVLIRQYRVAVDRLVLEIPAGKLDIDGETPREAAVRELEEEIGATPLELVLLGSTFPSPGYSSERIWLFAADGILWSERRPEGMEEQAAELVRLSWAEAVEMVGDGRITDAKTQIAVGIWERKRREL